MRSSALGNVDQSFNPHQSRHGGFGTFWALALKDVEYNKASCIICDTLEAKEI